MSEKHASSSFTCLPEFITRILDDARDKTGAKGMPGVNGAIKARRGGRARITTPFDIRDIRLRNGSRMRDETSNATSFRTDRSCSQWGCATMIYISLHVQCTRVHPLRQGESTTSPLLSPSRSPRVNFCRRTNFCRTRHVGLNCVSLLLMNHIHTRTSEKRPFPRILFSIRS